MKSKRAVHAKRSVGSQIVRRLQGFAEALESGKPISEQYSCRRVELDVHPTPHDAELVRQTREILNASQRVFATFLGVKVKTIQAWEQGSQKPSDMACRFMDEIRRDPKYWLNRFRGALVSK